MSTNDPRVAAISNLSDHQLLVMICTELRLQTWMTFQQEVKEGELEAMRAEIMNDMDYVDTDGTTGAAPSA